MLKFKKETVIDRFNDTLKVFLDLDIQVDGEVWLGGGALRHVFGCKSKIDDFDLFFDNGLTAAAVAVELEAKNFNCVFTCPLGELKTYKSFEHDDMKIQLITKSWYNSPQNLISTFDINACCIAYDGDYIYTTRDAIRDIKRQRVTLNTVTYPNATFRRMVKYHDKGYRIDREAINKYVDWCYEQGEIHSDMPRQFYVD